MPSTRVSNTQIATACGEMLLFVVVGYYALKFIVNALDPTNKQKTEAKKLVSASFHDSYLNQLAFA